MWRSRGPKYFSRETYIRIETSVEYLNVPIEIIRILKVVKYTDSRIQSYVHSHERRREAWLSKIFKWYSYKAEKQHIWTIEKLEPGNVWPICFTNYLLTMNRYWKLLLINVFGLLAVQLIDYHFSTKALQSQPTKFLLCSFGGVGAGCIIHRLSAVWSAGSWWQLSMCAGVYV